MTRRRILDAAVDTFAANGYDSGSTAVIAARAGVSPAQVFYYFPSKEDLLASILENSDSAVDGLVGPLLVSPFGERPSPPGWAAFDALVALAADHTAYMRWVQLFVRISAEATAPGHPAYEWISRHNQRIHNSLTEALEAGIEDGSVRRDTPTQLIVESTVALLYGLQQQWILDPTKVSVVDNVREHVRSLKHNWSTQRRAVSARPAAGAPAVPRE